MIEKCSLGNMNNNIKLIGLILLFCILFIVIIYYFRSTLKKHNDIVESFNINKATIIQDGGTLHDRGSPHVNETYNGEISMRKCQVYFVGKNEQSDCDKMYTNDPLSTNCKYEFKDGWNEIDTIKKNNNTITVPKKIYNKDYTNIDKIDNSIYMTACYKDRDINGNTIYKYENKDNVVIYGNGGSVDDETDNNKTLRLNVKEGNNDPMIKSYISKHFHTTGNTTYNNSKIISSICSIGYNNVVPTNLKNFYKFNLIKNGNEWVLNSIKDVELNESQTAFNGETDSNFIGSSAYGIYFDSKNTNSVSFSVFESTTLSDKDVKVYMFKYNYLCNDKILQYDTLDTKIIMTNLLNITGTISDNISLSKYIINYDNNIINSAFWDKFDFKLGNDNVKRDRSKIVLDKLTEQESISLNTIENDEKYSVSSYDATILRTNNLITSGNANKDKFHENITISNLITLNKVNTNIKPFDFKRGYYLNIVNQHSPFVTGNPNNVVTVSCISPNNITFGTPGLIGQFYEGYYHDNFSYFNGRSNNIISGSVTNFHGIQNMTNYGNGLVDWRKKQFQSSQQGGREHYSLKWYGFFYARSSDTYFFETNSDDASHLVINGNIVVNNGGLHGMHWRSGSIPLKKDTINTIEVYFGEYEGGDDMYIKWRTSISDWSYSDKLANTNDSYFYNTISSKTNFNYSSKEWKYSDGEYFIDIIRNHSSSPISLSSLMIDNKNIIISQTNDSWRLITSHSDGKYNYYYKNNSNGDLVQLKAILKIAEINKIVSDVVTISNQTYFDTLSIDNFRNDDNIKLNTGWNRTLSKHIFNRVIITGYVFLQEGHYTFYSDIDIASNNIIYKYNKLYIENLNSNNNISIQKINVTNGGFRKFSLSCFVLLKDVSNINFIFSAKLYTDDINTIDINLYDYIYGGDKLYNFIITDNTVFNNLLFNNNTKYTMSSIVKYLHDTHDYWNIKTNELQKETAEGSKLTKNGRKSDEKIRYSKEFNRVKELFKSLDFSGFTNTTDNIKWFNTTPPTLKNNILPSSIFNLYDETNYITYEKIPDVYHRTPTIVGNVGADFTTNFQTNNTVNTAAIYVLR